MRVSRWASARKECVVERNSGLTYLRFVSASQADSARIGGLWRVATFLAVLLGMSGFTAGNAVAASRVDGSVSAAGETCSWTNARASADPPSPLTIDRT